MPARGETWPGVCDSFTGSVHPNIASIVKLKWICPGFRECPSGDATTRTTRRQEGPIHVDLFVPRRLKERAMKLQDITYPQAAPDRFAW